MPELFTIGHSNHEPAHFDSLLRRAGIEVIADVRSWPRSRYAQWADGDQLPAWLREQGRRYVFLGRELGGRPDEDEFYDSEGRALYARIADTAHFRAGIKRLLTGIREHRVALMCSEEDPTYCHRRLLVAKVVLEAGVDVRHVRGDGRIEHEVGVGPPSGTLFIDDEETWWRSTQSVSHRARLNASSGV